MTQNEIKNEITKLMNNAVDNQNAEHIADAITLDVADAVGIEVLLDDGSVSTDELKKAVGDILSYSVDNV